MVVPLRNDWPGLRVRAPWVVHDGDGMHEVVSRLRDSAHDAATARSGSASAIRHAGERCEQSALRRWTAAELLAQLQQRSVSHVGAILEAVTVNLNGMAQRIDAVSGRYRHAEGKLQAGTKSVRKPPETDDRERSSTASAWTLQPKPNATNPWPVVVPEVRSVQGAVSLSVLGIPNSGGQPSPRTITSWLRELQRGAVWSAYDELASEWRSVAVRMRSLCHFLYAVAGELEQIWYDRAAPLAQQALRRVDGTAHVLEVFSGTLESRTATVAQCMRKVEPLRLGGRQRSDEERVVAVFLDLDNCFRSFLAAHPQELVYDLPFGGDLPGSEGGPLAWPRQPAPQDGIALQDGIAPPVIGETLPSAPPVSFWLPPDDAAPGVIG